MRIEPVDAILGATVTGVDLEQPLSDADLASLLRALGCELLYMPGVSTQMCVETTAREAADRGYLVTLVEDACATTHEDLHQTTMRNFQRLFGRVRATGEVLAELATTS